MKFDVFINNILKEITSEQILFIIILVIGILLILLVFKLADAFIQWLKFIFLCSSIFLFVSILAANGQDISNLNFRNIYNTLFEMYLIFLWSRDYILEQGHILLSIFENK